MGRPAGLRTAVVRAAPRPRGWVALDRLDGEGDPPSSVLRALLFRAVDRNWCSAGTVTSARRNEAAPPAIPKAFGVEVFEPGTDRPTARYRYLDD